MAGIVNIEGNKFLIGQAYNFYYQYIFLEVNSTSVVTYNLF
jgi:hypothetical protein